MPIQQPADKKPVVLCFSGHDPSGGAGIQADIEAIAAHGVHALTVITALTCQDSSHVYGFEPVNAHQMQQQAEILLKDIPINAIKVGMTASVAAIKAIRNILKQHPEIPVIFDPVLASGGGDSLSTEILIDAINTYLLPYCQLITPNIPEALKLAKTDNGLDLAAKSLLESGCQYVLITGTHSEATKIEHRLYHKLQPAISFSNERLAHEYHGSGCTLASSIAALIAQGMSIQAAVQAGLDYTFHSLQHGHAPGKGQLFPDRLCTLNRND
ncbi:MAG: hydroxymethylpyrimidine/phosphomethylpyrimidine kinase [Gammaproteobacteria bacterium]|nr:hydroxymethylpyrimidine/phosphomethylpyrimidine kinase [Gammaproteobacteria bacterium]